MTSTPKVFISYAWTSPEHIEWVVQFATDLRLQGVDIILDKWDLREGHDANAFMERMVTDPSVEKVIMICDAAYTAKADARSGGVGTEAQIISPKLYEKRDQEKFVAVIRELDPEGKAHVPVFYGSRIHIDMSNDEDYSVNLEQVLRWVFGKPLFVKPSIGKRPSYLDDSNAPQTGNSTIHRSAIDSLKRSNPNALLLAEDYLDSVVDGLETHRIPNTDNREEFDLAVLQSLDRFTPARNEITDLITTIARTHDNDDARAIVVKFLDKLLRYKIVPDHINRYREDDRDNYLFILSELFLHTIANLLKREKFEFASHLLDALYVEPARNGAAGTPVSFVAFTGHLASFRARNQRLQLNRVSLKADLLKDRCAASGIEFNELMQAEFILFLRSSFNAIRSPKTLRVWHPESLVYSRSMWGGFDMFVRSESKKYFDRIRSLLLVNDKIEFLELISQTRSPSFDYERVELGALANTENLCTQA